MAISFTPVNDGGGFYPNNVWAVWITNSANTWVRNINARAASKAANLNQWRAKYTVSPLRTGVDGVSGATAPNFVPFSGSWDLTNGKTTAKLPLGAYTVNMQFADDNGAGPYASVRVTIGASAIDTTVPNGTFPFHTNIHLVYTP